MRGRLPLFTIHSSLRLLVFALLRLSQNFVHPVAGRGALPHTPQTFFQEKSLTKNLFNR
jgi:hypothetical protein